MNEDDKLYKRSITIIDFISKKNPNSVILNEFKNILIKTYSKKNSRGLQIVTNDITAWAKSLPKVDYSELCQILDYKDDVDLRFDDDILKTIEKCLNSGVIENENEFRIIHEFLSDFQENDAYYSKNLQLDKLLQNYLNKL